MNALMREACAMIDGRGGGKSDMAQGGGKHVERLSAVVTALAERITDNVPTSDPQRLTPDT
jgi:alanyl-tRNA synthetase